MSMSENVINNDKNNLTYKFIKYISLSVREVQIGGTEIKYIDGYTGECKIYIPTLTVIHHNGDVELIEVKKASEQYPLTQYLYAQNSFNWRMISERELECIGEQDNERIIQW